MQGGGALFGLGVDTDRALGQDDRQAVVRLGHAGHVDRSLQEDVGFVHNVGGVLQEKVQDPVVAVQAGDVDWGGTVLWENRQVGVNDVKSRFFLHLGRCKVHSKFHIGIYYIKQS